MRELPEPTPILNADHELWFLERATEWVCRDANALCARAKNLADTPEVDRELHRAKAALALAHDAILGIVSRREEKKARKIFEMAAE